jgi:hypothetical protein
MEVLFVLPPTLWVRGIGFLLFLSMMAHVLLLRGNRDFESRTEYATFVRELLQPKNAGRQKRLAEELARLKPLPSHRLESFKRVRVNVNRGSVILRSEERLLGAQSADWRTR